MQGGEPVERLAQRDAGFESREVRARAEVVPQAERQVLAQLLGVTIEAEGVGIGKDIRVAIGCAEGCC